MGTTFVLFSPLDSSGDQFRENVNVLIQNLSGQNLTLDTFTEITENSISKMLGNASINQSNRIRKKTSECQHMIYSGDQGIFHLKFEQYFWIIKEKAYILTLTCDQSAFSKYKDVGESILNSFIFK